MATYPVFKGESKITTLPGQIIIGIWWDDETLKHYIGYTPAAFYDDSPVAKMDLMLGVVTSWN